MLPQFSGWVSSTLSGCDSSEKPAPLHLAFTADNRKQVDALDQDTVERIAKFRR
jgi:hypothetical protein